MCGRYSITTPAELGEYYFIDYELDKLDPRYNAAPGQALPTITKNKGKNELHMMKWGLIPVWAKDRKIGYKMINARAETVFEKNTWKRPVLNKRCLIPATGFYEWHKEGKVNQPYYIHLKDRPLYSFGGMYDHWTNKETGEVIESYTIITTEPNKEMEPIHDRMPLILHREDEDRWLNPENTTPESIADLLKPYDNGKLDVYAVDTAVGNVRNDNPSIIEPIKV